MGWITMSLRKMSLKSQISQCEMDLLQISAQTRKIQRNLSYETSIYETQKSEELKSAKEIFNSVVNARPQRNSYGGDNQAYSDALSNWETEYNKARMQYEGDSNTIKDTYESMEQILEEEANDRETALQQEQARVEAQLQALNAELEAVDDRISTDIDSEKISFGK